MASAPPKRHWSSSAEAGYRSAQEGTSALTADESSAVVADPAEFLDSGAGSTIFVDCRFNLLEPHAGFHAYLAAHVPGARYAHLDKDLSRQPSPHEGRHPLPDPSVFASWLGCVGIDRESAVVVYDDVGGAIAARLWWMLRWVGHRNCRILDGGMSAWLAAGGPTESGLASWEPRVYDLGGVESDNVVATEDLSARRAEGPLVDARAGPRFRGEVEPIDPVAGHVPGAVNLPFGELLDSMGRLRKREELRALFADRLGETREIRPIAMCGSGVTACLLLAAYRIACDEDGLLYVGSWSEWIRDPKRPIERMERIAH